jgi:hypothetical protein
MGSINARRTNSYRFYQQCWLLLWICFTTIEIQLLQQDRLNLVTNAWVVLPAISTTPVSTQSCPSSVVSTSSSHRRLSRLRANDHDNDSNNDDDKTPKEAEKQDTSTNNNNNWLEEWALEGAQKVAQLNIEERTQRALLAEMAEDKIYELSIELEKLIDEDTGEILDLVQAKEIARQTRSLQIQYRELVTGGPSSMLQAIESLKKQ